MAELFLVGMGYSDVLSQDSALNPARAIAAAIAAVMV